MTAVLDAGERPTAAIAIVLDVSVAVTPSSPARVGGAPAPVVDNAREYAILTLDLKRRITG